MQGMLCKVVMIEGTWFWEELEKPLDQKYHLIEHSCTHGGTDQEFDEVVSKIANLPLDFSRPLWQVHVIHGVAEGTSWGLVISIHHIVGDGMALSRLITRLMDFRAESMPEDPRSEEEFGFEEEPERIVSSKKIGSRSLFGFLLSPFYMVSSLVGPLLTKPDPLTALKSRPATGNLGLSVRNVAEVSELKKISKALGTTITALLVSVTAGAIARFAQEQDGKWPESMRAMVPASMRRYARKIPEGNAVGVLQIQIPTGIRDPIKRLKEVENQIAGLKNPWFIIGSLVGQYLIALLWNIVPINFFRRVYLRRATFLFSSVVGNARQMFLAGCPQTQFAGAPPVLDGLESSFAIVSSKSGLCVALLADQAVTKEPRNIINAFSQELATFSALCPPRAECMILK